MTTTPERTSTVEEPARSVDLSTVQLVDVLKALSDPVRLRIAQVLSPGEPVSRSETDWNCDLSRATMSHHFGVLRDVGLIASWAKGRTQWVQLQRDALQEHFPGLLTLIEAGNDDG